ncbi:MAG: hypothetical protein AAF628_32415 [Planctomycetota bacterium]
MKQTGYWWLAYEFRNLLFSCDACNSAKSDRFPLIEGATALEPEQSPDEVEEHQMLVDPLREDPGAHLTFVRTGGRYQLAPRSERGRVTIEVLGLRRDGLKDLYQQHVSETLAAVIRDYRRDKKRGDRNGVRRARDRAKRLCVREKRFSLLALCCFLEQGVVTLPR